MIMEIKNEGTPLTELDDSGGVYCPPAAAGVRTPAAAVPPLHRTTTGLCAVPPPLQCPIAGCGYTATQNRHLTQHMKQHEVCARTLPPPPLPSPTSSVQLTKSPRSTDTSAVYGLGVGACGTDWAADDPGTQQEVPPP
jgi:hypothetical protein